MSKHDTNWQPSGVKAVPAPADMYGKEAQPAEAEGVVIKIECTTCRGTGSLEFEGGAVVKDCAPCKGTGRDLKAERYALAARLAETIAALSAVTAERDRLREHAAKAQEHALDMGNKALAANQLVIEVRGVVYQSYIDRCDPEAAGECLAKIDAVIAAMAAKEA